ncbi:Uncharacterised protein [uncultured archaeon]|nr:Uncharacterised protein [uncultured archaeon]
MAKGQINAVSFLLSMIFYAVVIALLVGMIAVLQKDNLYAANRDALTVTGASITDMLSRSGGVPGNWETNTSSIQAIGLASTSNNLSVLKVNAFVALNYDVSRAALGIPNSTNYYFAIVNASGSVLKQSGVDSNSSGMALVFTRYVVWNGSSARMTLKLY